MAIARISEYKAMTTDVSGKVVPVASEPSVATQKVIFAATTASAGFNLKTKFIRVIVEDKAHFKISKAPIAKETDPHLPAHVPEYFGVRQGHKIAFYDGTS